jgi:rhodanese-related sulfurtransferase
MREKLCIALILTLSLSVWLPAIAKDQVSEIDAGTLNKWISEGKDLVLIDVGSQGDFAEAHVPGSISSPLNKNFPGEIRKIPKGKMYVLICPTGRRSFTAGKLMMENGFQEVYNLKGGTTDWIRHGLKIAKGM